MAYYFILQVFFTTDCSKKTLKDGHTDGQGGAPRSQYRNFRHHESRREKIWWPAKVTGQSEAAVPARGHVKTGQRNHC